MRFISVFLLIIFCIPAMRSAAQSSELGIMPGISSYKGDISSSLFATEFFHIAGGVHFKRCINNRWAYRLGINLGSISGEDADTDEPFNQFRNLNFKSNILELHFIYEFNFFEYQIANPESDWTPFVMAGLALFRFNPKGQLGDTWYDLQPLGTEGQSTSLYPQRKKYKRIQPSVPFGGGFKIRLNERFGIQIEAGARRTYTDYLDDISTTYPNKAVLLAENGSLAVQLSDKTIDRLTDNNNDRQRGDASHADWYMFAGVHLNFTLSRKYSDHCRPFKRKLH